MAQWEDVLADDDTFTADERPRPPCATGSVSKIVSSVK